MKYIKLMFLLVIALGIFACGSEKKVDDHAKAHDMKFETIDAVYYTCPMVDHMDVGHTEAGKCEKCDMDLVAVVNGTAEDFNYYGCPMAEHSGIRDDVPGTCPACGMELKPLKFKPI